MGSGPVGRDNRVKANHPISLCRNLVPQLDTALSPPNEDRGPLHASNTTDCSAISVGASVEAVASHFYGIEIVETPGLESCSDCIVCGKSVQEIQSETVNDYLDKTVAIGETPAETEARRRAFLDGMNARTFLLIPGRLRWKLVFCEL